MRTTKEISEALARTLCEKTEELIAERKYSEGPPTHDDYLGYTFAGLLHAMAVELEKLQH